MTVCVRTRGLALAGLAAALITGCSSGPPRYGGPTPGPTPAPPAVPPDPQPLGGDVLVRVGLSWEKRSVRIRATTGGLRWGTSPDDVGEVSGSFLELGAAGQRILGLAGNFTDSGPTFVRIEGGDDSPLVVGGRTVRGRIEITARADSLFVVNVLPLEDYLRGVVPREIGGRHPGEEEAVAAQAVAARTYTVRRLGQYGSLPFDVYASVQDQVYEGIGAEETVSDRAIAETRGLVLVTEEGLLEAYYSSTCGGARGDIVTVWPHRAPSEALRGGPDGPRGQEWCRGSPHFAWTERWTGSKLSSLVHDHVPAALGLPEGSVRGDLTDLRVEGRDDSGRLTAVTYETTDGSWRVPGDRNRWVLRRADGGILRSTKVELDVRHAGRRVADVTAAGSGNGHGVGMCQTGALARSRAGQTFREILDAYYPTARLRPLIGSDLPPGRGDAS